MDVEALLRSAISAGADGAEAYATRVRRYEVATKRGKIERAVASAITSIGARASVGRRVGGMLIANLGMGPEEAGRRLVELARRSPEDAHWPGFPAPRGAAVRARCLDERIVGLEPEEVVELHRLLIEKVEDAGRRHGGATVTEATSFVGLTECEIANTNGLRVKFTCSFHSTWFEVKLANGASYSGFVDNRRFSVDEVLREAERAVEMAALFVGAGPAEAGTYDAVLSPEAMIGILSSALAPAASALNILERRSPLAGRTGQQVLADSVTIVDDPTLDLESGTRGYDDEGLPTRRKEVFSRGTFLRPLHSYYTAARMGEEPTGNGFRASPASSPVPSFTNLVLVPGSGDVDELARDMRRGLVVYLTIGSWMSDPFSGRVKATVTHGLLVEGGRPARAVKGSTITGNVYEWLGDGLVALGSDVRRASGVSTPSALVRGVRVGG
ncbi:MAG: TldD/PmbA family protein [Desulfurococcaceae archaeon]